MLQSNTNQSELQSCYQIIQNQRQTGANYVVTLKQQQQNYTKKSNDRKPFMPTFALTGSMESAINLNPTSWMSVDCGRKPDYAERTHTDTKSPHRKVSAKWRIQTQDLTAVR